MAINHRMFYCFFLGAILLLQVGTFVNPSFAQTSEIPGWIKNNAGWWAEGQIDDTEFLQGIQFLVKEGIIIVEQEQTQQSVTEKEIQKKADGYWNCMQNFMPLPSNCIANDEELYTIGGIEEIYVISGYDVVCDPDCNLSLYEHYDVDKKLEKFQDENIHKQLFDAYVSITPKQLLDEVVFLYIETDDYGGEEAAAVGRDEFNPLKFTLYLDPVDMTPSAGPIDELFFKAMMIHENAHILSLGSSQSDNDIIDTETDEELTQIMREKESACEPNYFTDVSGCMKDYSYLNLFFQKFWTDIYPSFKWYFEFDDYDKFLDHNALFYQKYENQFETEYAATNPDEDFADSFTAFVLKEKPTKSTISEQRILFFYDFPELVEMRDFIRNNLT